MPDDNSESPHHVEPDWPTCATEVCIGRQIEGLEQAEALEQLRTELGAETERQLAEAVAQHQQQRAVLAAQLDDLTGRVTRAEADAARSRGDRDRFASELHTLRENLYLELAHGPDAAPLAGRIAAALGAGARRMARDADTEPEAGSVPDIGGEPR